MAKEIKLPDIPEAEQTPLVKGLLGIIEQLAERVQRQEEEIGRLKDEIAVLKGEKKRPRFKPSKLDQEVSGGTRSDAGRRCRDTFATFKKTCRKLGISFWDYLTDRVSGHNRIPPLPELVTQRLAQT